MSLIKRKECDVIIDINSTKLNAYKSIMKRNYDDLNKEYINYLKILPKITTNIQKSKRNVEFLNDK